MLTLFFLFVTIVFVILALGLASQNEIGWTVVSSVAALAFLLVLVFFIAPEERGMSRVPGEVGEFSRWLDAGKVYSVTATEDVNAMGEKILLVREEGSQKRIAIRVKVFAPLPERWTLINGRPVGVK